MGKTGSPSHHGPPYPQLWPTNTLTLKFGTGAVKITPAHDPNDYEVGQRQKLPSLTVIGLDGKMTADAGKYEGEDRYECRKHIVQDLKDLGLLVKIEDAPPCCRSLPALPPRRGTPYFHAVVCQNETPREGRRGMR